MASPIFEITPVDKRQIPHPKSDRDYFGSCDDIHMSSMPSSFGSENSDSDLPHDGFSGDEIFCETDPLLQKEKESLTDKESITEEACRDTDPLLPHAQYGK